MKVNTMAEMMAIGETPDILFWVGCAGSFDQRAQKITKAFATILDKVGMKYAILGKEEACTGDPARRAGNEFLFQMMAYQNIQVLNGYGIKKIVTTCPHCFNTLKNEYPELGGHYEVIHHTVLLQQLIDEGRIKMKESGSFKGKKISYHDSCYLGRANDIYEAPRKVLEALDAQLLISLVKSEDVIARYERSESGSPVKSSVLDAAASEASPDYASQVRISVAAVA